MIKTRCNSSIIKLLRAVPARFFAGAQNDILMILRIVRQPASGDDNGSRTAWRVVMNDNIETGN